MPYRVLTKNGRTYCEMDGRRVSRKKLLARYPHALAAEAPDLAAGLIGWKPILSDALAVHPLDAKRHAEEARAKGVPTDVLPDGRVVLSSRSHRKQYLKAFGFHDRSGGYGDG